LNPDLSTGRLHRQALQAAAPDRCAGALSHAHRAHAADGQV